MSDRQELMKIGEFAEHAGTNLRTLRYYEELGLLTPALRSDGGFRYYRPTDVNRVRMIHGLQELGLQLERIRDLLDTRSIEATNGEDLRQAWVQRVREALDEQRSLIDDRIGLLAHQREHVDRAAAKLEACTGCELTPAPENNYCEPCQRSGDELPEFLSALF